MTWIWSLFSTNWSRAANWLPPPRHKRFGAGMNVMRRFASATSIKLGGTSISCRTGVVRISNPKVFSGAGSDWEEFVERICGLAEVTSVDVDKCRGTAVVFYSPNAIRLEVLLDRLAVALAAPAATLRSGALARARLSLPVRSRIRLF